MKKSTVFFLIAVLAFSMGGIAQAGSPWTEKTTYKEKVIGKLDFGFKNFLGGWTALFSEPKKEEKNAGAITRGIGRGIAYAGAYTLGGILHLVTFPVPQVDVPLPNGGVNLD